MLALIIVCGLLLGSLLNLVIVRLPREKRMLGWPRCTRCGRPLAWWQLVPVLGWLLQGGTARCCQRRLHWIHPLIDLAMVGCLVALYLQYGLSLSLVYLGLICALLLLIGAIDYLHRYIYNIVVFGGTLLALLAASFVPDHSLILALIGALTGGLVFSIFFVLARFLFPGHAVPFGLGDVYLAIFIGTAVGFLNLGPALLYGILLAGIAALPPVIARYLLRRPAVSEYMAYGSYLCVGTIAYILIWGLGR